MNCRTPCRHFCCRTACTRSLKLRFRCSTSSSVNFRTGRYAHARESLCEGRQASDHQVPTRQLQRTHLYAVRPQRRGAVCCKC